MPAGSMTLCPNGTPVGTSQCMVRTKAHNPRRPSGQAWRVSMNQGYQKAIRKKEPALGAALARGGLRARLALERASTSPESRGILTWIRGATLKTWHVFHTGILDSQSTHRLAQQRPDNTRGSGGLSIIFVSGRGPGATRPSSSVRRAGCVS